MNLLAGIRRYTDYSFARPVRVHHLLPDPLAVADTLLGVWVVANPCGPLAMVAELAANRVRARTWRQALRPVGAVRFAAGVRYARLA